MLYRFYPASMALDLQTGLCSQSRVGRTFFLSLFLGKGPGELMFLLKNKKACIDIANHEIGYNWQLKHSPNNLGSVGNISLPLKVERWCMMKSYLTAMQCTISGRKVRKWD